MMDFMYRLPRGDADRDTFRREVQAEMATSHTGFGDAIKEDL